MKTLLPLIFIFCCSFSAKAQWLIGAKGGFNYSWFKETNPDVSLFGNDWQGLAGYQFGLFLQRELDNDDSFFVRGELYYASEGSRNKNLPNEDYVNIRSINIPLFLRLHFPEDFYIEGGFDFGHLRERNYDFVKPKFEMSLLAGIGFKFNRLGLNLRYVHAVSDLYDFDFQIINGQVKGRSRVFQLGAEIYIFGETSRSWYSRLW